MIKANEVRLGNWVANSISGAHSQITAMDISDIEYGYKTRLGIPLTEDILLKCGFTPNAVGLLAIELNDIASHLEMIITPHGFYPAIDQMPPEEGHQYISLPKIEYLHQLQNLFFTLTQTELQITNL